jgi:hypothetical protein
VVQQVDGVDGVVRVESEQRRALRAAVGPCLARETSDQGLRTQPLVVDPIRRQDEKVGAEFVGVEGVRSRADLLERRRRPTPEDRGVVAGDVVPIATGRGRLGADDHDPGNIGGASRTAGGRERTFQGRRLGQVIEDLRHERRLRDRDPAHGEVVDVVVGGCAVSPPLCLPLLVPTQPDVGTGGQPPATLTADPTTGKVTVVQPEDAYSTWLEFAAERVHMTNNLGGIFADGFDSSGLGAWSSSQP